MHASTMAIIRASSSIITGGRSRATAISTPGDSKPQDRDIEAAFEPRAGGVQTNPISATNSVLVFAVNSYGRFSNPATGEYDIYIDVNGDGKYEFILFSGDVGAVQTGTANGQIGAFLLNRATGKVFVEPPADAPTDGSIVLMPVLASHLGLSPTNPRFSYTVNAF